MEKNRVLSSEEKEFMDGIFQRLEKKVLRMAMRILKSQPDAEEVLGSTMIKIAENMDKILSRPENQRDAYCMVIAKNETMDFYNQQKIVQPYEVDILGEEISFMEEEREYLPEAKECLLQLSKEERMLLHLRFFEQMLIKDMASLWEVKEEAMKKRHQRIIQKVRNCIEEKVNERIF
ncbi:MAG: sigma-70 family RNA polymerase sigma factor [Tissierellia bacterium]|nr:sigma-70 family RNA polymerase sigma factor [Tissierellia bacterium]